MLKRKQVASERYEHKKKNGWAKYSIHAHP